MKKEFIVKLLLGTNYAGNEGGVGARKESFRNDLKDDLLYGSWNHAAKELVAIYQNNRSNQTVKAASVDWGLAQRSPRHARKHIFTYISWRGVNRGLSR